MLLIPGFYRPMKANLKAAFPEKPKAEINKLAFQSLKNIILSLLEFCWFLDRPKLMRKYIDFKDEVDQMCRRCCEDGENFILVTPHLGNWELAGLVMSEFSDVKFAVVARPARNPYLNKFINAGRMMEGNKVIPTKGAVKGMLKALKEGYAMATLIDQNTRVRDGGVFVDFFGLPVPTSKAPAFFGRKFNVLIAVGGCISTPGGYETFLRWLPKKSGDYDSDEELIQDLMKITEELVRQYPEQYLWFYKRFQYIPREADEELIKCYPDYATIAEDRFYDKVTARKNPLKN
jgi:KDO2-lipid IV(A) lauroyltransferase